MKSFVEQQQYFFDMLWSKAIPAEQRIKEFEEGHRKEFFEVIDNPEWLLKFILIWRNQQKIMRSCYCQAQRHW